MKKSSSSKLTTRDAMVQYLACLRAKIASRDLSLSDFLDFTEFFHEFDSINDALSGITLILEVDGGQQNLAQSYVRDASEEPDGSYGRLRATCGRNHGFTGEISVEDARFLNKLACDMSFIWPSSRL